MEKGKKSQLGQAGLKSNFIRSWCRVLPDETLTGNKVSHAAHPRTSPVMPLRIGGFTIKKCGTSIAYTIACDATKLTLAQKLQANTCN